MTIELCRGDSHACGFILKDKSTMEPNATAWDDIYFTVKEKYCDRDYLFQKRLSTGGITSDGNGHYTITILPRDTDGLPFGEFDCDIELKKATYKKTFFGTIKISQEVTHCYNE